MNESVVIHKAQSLPMEETTNIVVLENYNGFKLNDVGKLQRRACCHSCGNVRKNQRVCNFCPYVFCQRCVEKQIKMYGQDVFDLNGCPVCKKLCCCALKNPNCNKLYHCYKKCQIYKAFPIINSNIKNISKKNKTSRNSSTNSPFYVSPFVIPHTSSRTQISLLVTPPLPEHLNQNNQHLLPLSLVLDNFHRLPKLPTASTPLLSSTTNSNTLDHLLLQQQKEEEKSQFSQCSHDSKSWGSALSNSEQNSQGVFSQSVFEKTAIKFSSPSNSSNGGLKGSTRSFFLLIN